MTPTDAQRLKAEEQSAEIRAMLETARTIKGDAFADLTQAILVAWRVQGVLLPYIPDPLVQAAARTNVLWLVDRIATYAAVSGADVTEARKLAETMFKLSFV